MADPTRPVQDAIIDPAWGQWVHDRVAVIPGIARGVNYSGTTDVNGYLAVPASAFGLSKINGGAASITTTGAGTVVNFVGEVTPFSNNTVLLIRICKITTDTNDMNIYPSTTVAVSALAWGTP